MSLINVDNVEFIKASKDPNSNVRFVNMHSNDKGVFFEITISNKNSYVQYNKYKGYYNFVLNDEESISKINDTCTELSVKLLEYLKTESFTIENIIFDAKNVYRFPMNVRNINGEKMISKSLVYNRSKYDMTVQQFNTVMRNSECKLLCLFKGFYIFNENTIIPKINVIHNKLSDTFTTNNYYLTTIMNEVLTRNNSDIREITSDKYNNSKSKSKSTYEKKRDINKYIESLIL